MYVHHENYFNSSLDEYRDSFLSFFLSFFFFFEGELRGNRAHHDYHTMDNHTIYKEKKKNEKKKNAEQQPEEKFVREKVESPETTNCIKCTQAH